MKFTPFIKAIAYAYLQETVVFMEKEKLTEIETILREINARIAESIQYVHLSEKVSLKDIETLKTAIFKLEKSIAKEIHQPPRLNVWIGNYQKRDPLFISKLLKSIAKFLAQSQ